VSAVDDETPVTATADQTREVSAWPAGHAGAVAVASRMSRWTSKDESQVRQR
jgi:hypothetical protein